MDMKLLATDVEKTLDLLPPQVVTGVMMSILPHQTALMSAVPQVVPLMKPHLAAGGIEHAAGMLDLTEIATTLIPIIVAYLQRHGVIPHGATAANPIVNAINNSLNNAPTR